MYLSTPLLHFASQLNECLGLHDLSLLPQRQSLHCLQRHEHVVWQADDIYGFALQHICFLHYRRRGRKPCRQRRSFSGSWQRSWASRAKLPSSSKARGSSKVSVQSLLAQRCTSAVIQIRSVTGSQQVFDLTKELCVFAAGTGLGNGADDSSDASEGELLQPLTYELTYRTIPNKSDKRAQGWQQDTRHLSAEAFELNELLVPLC